MRKKETEQDWNLPKRPYSQRKKVAVSVMLFAVLMQLVMQPMSVHASIQSASGKKCSS